MCPTVCDPPTAFTMLTPITATAELVSQRRRWLNGSFAASIYSLVHFFEIYRSRHNIIRLFFFHIQALFNIAVLVFTWFAPSNLVGHHTSE